ncbi:hypothetical protein DNTS_017119 [Danionella cerebrum]|uniref:Pentacotripeptide-repeat region of PRORP domain-containing protein n=1 Tax=Danionella cerebrum TaxID=2873325 RepID=A0A553NG92_9TELE|nr:hypothetical protein DNTS_017119 [Danionella translucida]
MLYHMFLRGYLARNSSVNVIKRGLASINVKSFVYTSNSVIQGHLGCFNFAACYSNWKNPSWSTSDNVESAGSDGVDDNNETFGDFSGEYFKRRPFRKLSPDDLDLKFGIRRHRWKSYKSNVAQKKTPHWYFEECKKLIKVGNVDEAINMFETVMLKDSKQQPKEFNYTALIGGCAHKGNLKKAFQLYNNSPCKKSGLKHALKLKQELLEKRIPLGPINYRAFLQTVALAGDLKDCCQIFREMVQNGQLITQMTFHYLLMSCANDKEIGFRQALQVWHQMLRIGLKPDVQNYNILLRITRDCGIGDHKIASALLLKRSEEKKDVPRSYELAKKLNLTVDLDMDEFETELFINSQTPTHESTSESQSTGGRSNEDTQMLMVTTERSLQPQLNPSSESIPNLLDPSSCSSTVALGPVNCASERLALIGNVEGFLENMAQGGVNPDNRTLTLLADVCNVSHNPVHTFIDVSKKNGIDLDLTFYNTMINKVAKAGDLNEVKRLDYDYLLVLLKQMDKMQVPPNEVIIKQLEFASQYPPSYNKFQSRNVFLDKIDGFRGFYKQWLERMPAEETPHHQAKKTKQNKKDQRGSSK